MFGPELHCETCSGVLSHNTALQSILTRAKEPSLHINTNLLYQNFVQISARNKALAATHNGIKLQSLAAPRRLATALTQLSRHDRILVSIASMVESGSYMRVHAIIANCYKRKGEGLVNVYNEIARAIGSYYKPASYSEKEYDIALIALKIGGRRMLSMLSQSQSHGFASLSSLHRYQQKLGVCNFQINHYGFQDDGAEIVEQNVNSVFRGIKREDTASCPEFFGPEKSKTLNIVQFDEMSITPSLLN
jgi:hypothetical protein